MSDGECQHNVDAMWKTTQLMSFPKDRSLGHKNKKDEKTNGALDKAPPAQAPVLAVAPAPAPARAPPVANEVDVWQKTGGFRRRMSFSYRAKSQDS